MSDWAIVGRRSHGAILVLTTHTGSHVDIEAALFINLIFSSQCARINTNKVFWTFIAVLNIRNLKIAKGCCLIIVLANWLPNSNKQTRGRSRVKMEGYIDDCEWQLAHLTTTAHKQQFLDKHLIKLISSFEPNNRRVLSLLSLLYKQFSQDEDLTIPFYEVYKVLSEKQIHPVGVLFCDVMIARHAKRNDQLDLTLVLYGLSTTTNILFQNYRIYWLFQVEWLNDYREFSFVWIFQIIHWISRKKMLISFWIIWSHVLCIQFQFYLRQMWPVSQSIRRGNLQDQNWFKWNWRSCIFLRVIASYLVMSKRLWHCMWLVCLMDQRSEL